MLPVKYQFIWPSGFRGEDFSISANQKQESSIADMFVDRSRRNYEFLQRTSHRCFLSNNSSFGQAVSEKKTFSILANQKQESSMAAIFVNRSGRNEENLYRTSHRCFLSNISSFGQAVSEEKIFLFQPIRNKNCPWRPYLSTDQDEMRKLYTGPLIDASCQISVHLAKRFQRRRFFYFSQSETRIVHGGHICRRIRTK